MQSLVSHGTLSSREHVQHHFDVCKASDCAEEPESFVHYLAVLGVTRGLSTHRNRRAVVPPATLW